jgi:hypothetical protein
VLLSIAAEPSAAGTLFVRAGGDDGADGRTIAAALATINAATSLARPGDTIVVGSGVYAAPVRFPNSGAPGTPIVLRSAPGQRATISVSSDTAFVLAGVSDIVLLELSIDRNVRPMVIYGARRIRVERCRFDQTGAGSAAYNMVQIFGSSDIRFVEDTLDGGWSSTADGIRVNYGGPQGYTSGLLVQNCFFTRFNHYAVNTVSANYHTMLIGNRATANHGTLAFNQGTGRGMVAFNVMDTYVPNITESAKGGLGQYFSDSALVRYNTVAQMTGTGGVLSTGAAFAAASIYDDSIVVRDLRSYNNTVWASIPSGLRWYFGYGIEASRASSEMRSPRNLNNIVVGGSQATWLQRSPGYTSVGDFSDYNDGNMLWGPGTAIRYDFAGTASYTVGEAQANHPTHWGPGNQWTYPSMIDTLGDFSPAGGSNVIDAGRHLAIVTRAESPALSRWITVDDPLVFFDGWGMVPGDSLWIGGRPALLVRQGQDTLYLESAVAGIGAGDSVSVLSAWDGSAYRPVLIGARPDIGARESGVATETPAADGSFEFAVSERALFDKTPLQRDTLSFRSAGAPIATMYLEIVNKGLTYIRRVLPGPQFTDGRWRFSVDIDRATVFNDDESTTDTAKVTVQSLIGPGLEAGDYPTFLVVEYEVVNIADPDTQRASLEMLTSFGSLRQGSNAPVASARPLTLTVVNRAIRGDTNNDDHVDVLDIFQIASHLLRRKEIGLEVWSRADLAPWGGPDGVLNAQDVSLLVNVILMRTLPDGTPVGKLDPLGVDGGWDVSSGPGAEGDSTVASALLNNGVLEIRVTDGARIGALQVEFEGPGAARAPSPEVCADGEFHWNRDDVGLRAAIWNPQGFGGLARQAALLTMQAGADPDSFSTWVTVSDTSGSLLFRGPLPIRRVQTSPVPVSFALGQNYPNPFNPSTRLGFDLPEETRVRMSVFDILGREVRVLVDSRLHAGRHVAIWDGADDRGTPVAGGVYICRIEAAGQETGFTYVQSRKMLLLK